MSQTEKLILELEKGDGKIISCIHEGKKKIMKILFLGKPKYVEACNECEKVITSSEKLCEVCKYNPKKLGRPTDDPRTQISVGIPKSLLEKIEIIDGESFSQRVLDLTKKGLQVEGK